MKDPLDNITRDGLVEVGRLSQSASCQTKALLDALKRRSAFLRSNNPDLSFDPLLNASWDDACSLVRGLLMAENAGISLFGGSVSLVKYAFRVLERRNRVAALEVASWIVDHSDNDYIPFEMRKIRHAFSSLRKSTRTWQECRERLDQWEKEEWARQRAMSIELQQQEALAIEKHRILEAVRTRCAEETHQIQKARSVARQNFINTLSKASAQARLEHIAWDDSHGLGYYPIDFAQVSSDTFASVSDQTRNRFFQKLKARRKEPWKSLYEQLTALNKPYDPRR